MSTELNIFMYLLSVFLFSCIAHLSAYAEECHDKVTVFSNGLVNGKEDVCGSHQDCFPILFTFGDIEIKYGSSLCCDNCGFRFASYCSSPIPWSEFQPDNNGKDGYRGPDNDVTDRYRHPGYRYPDNVVTDRYKYPPGDKNSNPELIELVNIYFD